jgi:hypothetical protein
MKNLLLLLLLQFVAAVTYPVKNDREPMLEQEIRAFLDGFKMNDFVPMSYECLNSYFNTTQQYNYTRIARNNSSEEQLKKLNLYYGMDIFFNYTDFISNNVSYTWYDCGVTTYGIYDQEQAYAKLFGIPNTTASYPISALQALLSNVLYLTDLNKRATAAIKAEDYLVFDWLMGRAVRTFIVVPPLKIDNFDDY